MAHLNQLLFESAKNEMRPENGQSDDEAPFNYPVPPGQIYYDASLGGSF